MTCAACGKPVPDHSPYWHDPRFWQVGVRQPICGPQCSTAWAAANSDKLKSGKTPEGRA